MGKLKAVGLGVKALEDAFKAEQAAEKMYTAADRARAGNKAAKLIKSQPKVKASEALGQAMEKGYKKVSTTQSDRTQVGNDNIGGAPFSAISEVDPAYKGKVWGVMDEGTASRLTNLSSPETIWTTMLGSANQLKTNPVVFDKLKKQFIAAMKEGKLSKELEAKFNHNLELTFGEGAQIRDPNIWKEADTFEKRAALADLMMGQGITPKKGGVAMGGEKSGKGVIFKPTDTLIQETEPSLLHPEHGGSVPTFALGPRLFNLSGTAEMRPDLHPGFPMLLHGEDLGYNFEPVPTEVFLPTWHKHFRDIKPERFQGPWAEEIINRRKNKSYKLKGAEGPGYYDLALGLEGEGLPSQDLHDEFIRHLIREGYAEGGAVHMGKGGLLSKAARELEEAMTKLPRGSNAAKEKIEREFAEAQAKKDALYKVEKPPVEKGNKALAEAKRILTGAEKQAPAKQNKAQQFIDRVNDEFSPHPFMPEQRVISEGEGESQKFAQFELKPNALNKNAVEIDWISAYPQRSGMGTKAIQELQKRAQEDGITLTLYPWDKGQVSQRALTSFYKGLGFKPSSKGSKSLVWTPEENTESLIQQIEAPSVIIPSKLSEVERYVKDREGSYGVDRVQRAADQVKNLEQQYTEEALKQAFSGDNARALMIGNPADFQKYAAAIETPYRPAVRKYKGLMTEGGGGAEDVPYLMLDKEEGMLPRVWGHEGRHRNLALEELGDENTLWRMLPQSSLRERFPRRYQDEYINAIRDEIGERPLVLPEDAVRHDSKKNKFIYDFGRAINLPELFAEGGGVHMAEGSGVTRPRKYVPPSQLIPIATQEFPLQKPANVTEADMTPTELHPLAGSLSRGVANVHEFVSKPFGYANPPMEMASELMGLPSISKTLENYAYGTPNTKGSGQATRLNEEAVDAAMSLPFGSGQAIKAGVKGAVKGAKELAPTAGKLAQEFAESTQFGLPFELNVVKPKGGNWTTYLSPVRDLKRKDFIYGKTPEEQLIKYNEFFNNPENLANTLPEEIAILENKRQKFTNQVAINKWLDTKLTNYIKNEMATPEDSIRLGIERRLEEAQKVKEANDKKLANMKAGIDKRKAEGKDVTLSERDYQAAKEKADEENIFANKSVSHLTAPDSGWNASDDGLRLTKPHVDKNRVDAGYPVKGMGKNQASQQWEDIADEAVEINPASQYINEAKNEKIRKSGGTPAIDVEPWITKVAEKDPNTPIYNANNISIDHRSDFRHMIDELQDAMSPNSKLPEHLRIKPKDLEKMTVDDVSHLSGKISAWRDIQKRKIDKDVANNPAMHTFKEYTENNPKGVKWQQIKRPEGYPDDEAEKYVRAATQYEGDLMRHCVGGSGHCDPLLDGEVEIYTLRDARGEPHVTIEVSTKVDPQAKGNTPKDFYLSMPMEAMAKLPPMPSPTNASFADITYWERKVRQTPQYQSWLQSRPKDIGEIKGKGNKKPNEEYIPFIQDFIRSGNWGKIRDIQNTDLYDTSSPDLINFALKTSDASRNDRLIAINRARRSGELKGFMSREEYEPIVRKYLPEDKPREGYAAGGAVQSPNGFDYESHVNNIMNAHNASNFDYEGHVNKIMRMAEGGAAYNTQPDMSDGGLSIPAAAFKIGGRIPLLTR